MSTHAAAVNFSREDERRLAALTQQLTAEGRTAAEGFEDPALQAEYAALTAANELFLEEGERRLNNCNASPLEAVTSGPYYRPPREQSSYEKVKSGLYFWTTLVGKAVPACVNTMTGALPSRKTWHFITDQLILGGVPVVTKVGTSGDHLGQLKTQLAETIDPDTKTVGRHELGLVVACLTQEELDGYGMPSTVVEFAQKFHWHSEFGTGVVYAHVPMPDTTSDVSMDLVRGAVDLIHDTISESLEDALATMNVADVSGGEGEGQSSPHSRSRALPPKRCAYIHCKAGVGRSWMVLMCYLVTHGGRSYANADQLVRMARPFVNPSPSQVEFVRDFAIKFEADERAKRLMAGLE